MDSPVNPCELPRWDGEKNVLLKPQALACQDRFAAIITESSHQQEYIGFGWDMVVWYNYPT